MSIDHSGCVPAAATMTGTHVHQGATGFWHFAQDAPRCGWKIRLVTMEAQCTKKLHVAGVRIIPAPGGRFSAEIDGTGDNEHTATMPNGTILHWSAADRREFRGTWPG